MKKNNKLQWSCPCGAIPTELCLTPGSSMQWAQATCNVCGEWSIEFRTQYKDLNSPEATKLALKAWNDAPRAWK